MPLPQVNDRLKEIPAQALRTLFASIGQLLLAVDRLRARATEQLSGSGEATAAPPSAPAPVPPAPPAPPAAAPAQDAESARWRSLDKTGNVRLLGEDDEDPAVPAGSTLPESSQTEPSRAEPAAPDPVPAPSEYTPTEPVPAITTPAEPAPPVPDPADLAPAVPDPADLAPAPPGSPAVATGTLPVPNYDQLTVASLRARLRVLDAAQVQVLLDYEKAHEGRPAVITMFERRITKLSDGS